MSDDPEDRLSEVFKSPYNTDAKTLSAIISAFSNEFEEFEDALSETNQNKFIETADPAQLEKLASLFDTTRRTGEPIDEFRARLSVQLRSQISSGRISEIRDVTSVVLDIDTEEIEIIEPFDLEPAFIELNLPSGFDDNVRPSTLIDIIREVTAAGVDVGIRFTTDSASVFVIGDASAVRPLDGNVGRDTTVLTDGEQTEPFPENYFAESVIIGDFEQTEPFPENYFAEQSVLADTENVRTDATDEAFWDDGRWSMNIWPVFEQLPDEMLVDGIAFTDSVEFDDPPDTELLSCTDDGFVHDPEVATDITTFTDDGVVSEYDADTDTTAVSDDVTVTPHETAEYHWNDGLWGFGIWTTEASP